MRPLLILGTGLAMAAMAGELRLAAPGCDEASCRTARAIAAIVAPTPSSPAAVLTSPVIFSPDAVFVALKTGTLDFGFVDPTALRSLSRAADTNLSADAFAARCGAYGLSVTGPYGSRYLVMGAKRYAALSKKTKEALETLIAPPSAPAPLQTRPYNPVLLEE